MSEPLQQFDWKHSSYERPGDQWVCGRACDGCACPLGPTANGDCSVQSQCEPELTGDRWKCTRAAIHGGKCEEGPDQNGKCCQTDESCQPVMSRRRRRRVIGMLCAAASFAICLIAVATFENHKLLSPGEITSAHANIEASCAACHIAAESGSLVEHAFDRNNHLADSKKCLECHRNLGSDPLLAHSLDSHSLAGISAAANRRTTPPLSLRVASLARSENREAQMACSNCHREHHGRQFDLTRVSDQQCQSCHKQQFTDFAHGHPEFLAYPHERRTKIYFDHARHLNIYFQESEFRRQMPNGVAPADCVSCHETNRADGMMLTKGFDRTCGSCHEPQIADLSFPGIAFMAIPQLSAIGGERDDQATVHWPATEDSLRKTPPYMKLLLNSSPAEAQATSPPEPLTLQIKRLLHEVQTDGEQAIEKRFRDDQAPLAAATRSIAPVLVQATSKWFPTLEDELDAVNHEQSLAATEESSSAASRTPQNVRGWYFSEVDQTVRYRPVGHGDPVMRQILDHLNSRIGLRKHADAETELFAMLANPSGSGSAFSSMPLSTGRCLSCHSVDRDAFGNSRINWHARRLQTDSSFTKFRHQPHVLSKDSDSCRSCHEMSKPAEASAYRDEYFLRDTSGFWEPQTDPECPSASGLLPVRRVNCATCHNQEHTSQSCLQCHNYHVHNP